MAQTLEHNQTVTTVTPITLPRFEGDTDVIQQLDDEPNDVGGLSAQELKAKFDEAAAALANFINDELIPAVVADDATEQARQAAEAERVSNEQERVANENARITAEAARALAEQGRVTAENDRGRAEELRNTEADAFARNEVARISAESARATAETVRQGAEQARQAAEAQRAANEAARQALPIKGGTGTGALIENDTANNEARGAYSHAEGLGTTAEGNYQHVSGKYNHGDPVNRYAEIVGNGTADNARGNARTLDWSGNEWLAGKLTLGAQGTEAMDAATRGYVDLKTSTTLLLDATAITAAVAAAYDDVFGG